MHRRNLDLQVCPFSFPLVLWDMAGWFTLHSDPTQTNVCWRGSPHKLQERGGIHHYGTIASPCVGLRSAANLTIGLW